jgi:hypothetical protein
MGAVLVMDCGTWAGQRSLTHHERTGVAGMPEQIDHPPRQMLTVKGG